MVGAGPPASGLRGAPQRPLAMVLFVSQEDAPSDRPPSYLPFLATPLSPWFPHSVWPSSFLEPLRNLANACTSVGLYLQPTALGWFHGFIPPLGRWTNP